MLQLGDFKMRLTEDKQEVGVFWRTYRNQVVIVVLNNSDRAQQVSVLFAGETDFTDVLNNGTSYSSNWQKITLNLPAKGGTILVRK